MKEKFIISLLSQFFSNFIILFAVYLLYVNLSVKTLGLWVFLTSVLNIGFLFIDIGLDSIYYQYSGKEDFGNYFSSFAFLKVLLILINLIISLILLGFLGFYLSDLLFAIVLLLIDKILFCTTNIIQVNLKARLKFFKTEIPFFLFTLGKGIAIIIIALNSPIITNPILFIAISYVFFSIILLVVIVILSKNEFSLKKPDFNLILKYLKDIKPLFLFSMISVIAANLGILMIFYYFGDEPLGYLGLVSNSIIPILLTISESLIYVYLPLFSRLYEKRDFDSLKKILFIIEKYSSIVFLCIIMIVFLNGDLIIAIFLPNFTQSIPILKVMIFIPFFHGIALPYAYLFISGKKQSVIAYINTSHRILIIGLMIILIPSNLFMFPMFYLGGLGFALAQTIPWILWSLLCHYFAYKYFKIGKHKGLLLNIVLALLAFVITMFLKNILIVANINKLVLLLSSTMIVISIYMGLLFASKQLDKKDIKFFVEIFKLKKYSASLKEEL